MVRAVTESLGQIKVLGLFRCVACVALMTNLLLSLQSTSISEWVLVILCGLALEMALHA
jgi:hypothetical protein